MSQNTQAPFRDIQPSKLEAPKWEAPGYAFVILLFAVLLTASTLYNLSSLNQDAVSYLSLAQSYHAGHFSVAVSGVWSPMFIWLWSLLLNFPGDPVALGRVAMAVSGVAFLAGAASVFWLIENRVVRLVCFLVAAVFAAGAVGEAITPDLLSAGLYAAAFGLLFRSWKRRSIGLSFASGCVFGAAYLAKAVFFPVSVLVLAVGSVIAWYTKSAPPKVLLRLAAAGLVGLTLVSAPWIGVLTSKYGQLTFTRISLVNSSVVAPPDVRQDYLSFSNFVVPEQGRLSQWEDESVLPALRPWSPLHDLRSAVYFAEMSLTNTPTVLGYVRNYDWAGIGLIGLLVALIFAIGRRVPITDLPIAAFAVPAFILMLPYVPFRTPFPLDERRYFFCILPFVFAGGIEAARRIGLKCFGERAQVPFVFGMAALFLVAVVALVPMQAVNSDVTAETSQFRLGRQLAPMLRGAGVDGPVASTSRETRENARYLAVGMNQAFHGAKDVDSVDELDAACARILVARRESPIDRLMSERPDKYQDVVTRSPAVDSILKTKQLRIYLAKASADPACQPPPLYWAGRRGT